MLDPYCGTDPLQKALARINGSYRGLSCDILTPSEVAADVRKLNQHETQRQTTLEVAP